MEAILYTYRELIRTDWPTKVTIGTSSVPSLYNTPIYGWYHGDREILPEEFPAIVFDPESMSLSWNAMHMQERSWKWDVLLLVRADQFDAGLSYLNAFYRLFECAARKQSHFWIFEPCIFNMRPFADPQYLIDLNTSGTFAGVLDPYIALVQDRFDTSWDNAHKDYLGVIGSGPAAPTISEVDLHIAAYMLLFDTDPLTDAWATTNVTFTPKHVKDTQTTTPANIISRMRTTQILPVRFMGDSMIESASFGYVQKGNALLRGVQVTIYGKEQDPLSVFGPK